MNLHGIPRKRKDGSEIKLNSVNDFEDELHLPTLFSQATDLINDLKTRLKESQNTNKSNMQAIDSLKKELEELDKINERLENQLYKYQYDITRVTDILLNDVYPSVEELEQEEEGIDDMSEQEQHLYVLLKRASDLRDKEKDYSDKINVYTKDIEELLEKNRFLSNIEDIKNEVCIALEEEKKRVVELECILDDKSHSFNILLDEKENLHISYKRLQSEKDELKNTLDTLHQLRDQEEEEIEKTLDEAKSIIQKLEEKLHSKDDKIKKYKERLTSSDQQRQELEKQLSIIDEEFKDKEKNMKLKLLWAQMEKKDLATTILKLENSAHNITQSGIKPKNNDA